MSKIEINETHLQAYVDGLGSESRRAEIERLLAEHPEEADRLLAYQNQSRALHELFDPVLSEPLPESLLHLASPPAERPVSTHSRWSLQRIAASVVLVLVGGATGWLLHDQFFNTPMPLAQAMPLARQAAVAHVVFSPDMRRPVEIGADHEDQLVTWLSKRLGKPVRPPKLGPLGFDLIGGRLLPGTSGPVAQFMYQDTSGQRLTLMVSTEISANQDTAFRFLQEGDVNVFYWIDGKYGYALTAGISKNDLARVATAVYDQFNH